jgi:DNA-binding transcriptional LysR family regulator
MSHPDLNLLVTLDVLLAEGSVARAARRLHLSPSAMSRALARLRDATGDPLLVRAGRGLVPTPRAEELRRTVGRIVQEAEALLRPAEILDLSRLQRTFTLRNREGFVDTFGPALLARIAHDAPGVKLRFVSKPDKESAPLRDGSVDLETGVIGDTTGPEVRAQALFRDRFVGVVRRGHPLLDGPVTAERYAAGAHVIVSRRQLDRGPVDEALARLGLARTIAVTVASFSEALTLARGSDLVAQVSERSTGRLRDGMATFPLPVDLPGYTVSMLWHPRMDADPAHRWLRTCLRAVCTGKAGDFPPEQC